MTATELTNTSITTVTTRRGIECKVHVRGTGPALVWLHGTMGLQQSEPLLDQLAADHTVYAPEWPGFGDEPTETMLENMSDFALHGWDVIVELGLDRPALGGHSMGAMIAAEMAALNPQGLSSLVLSSALGLWDDDHPIPDLFAMLPFQVAELLFHDPAAGEAFLAAGQDFSDDAALTAFMIRNSRRLGTAGKILFPIPNRRLSDRLYRITIPTLLVWGADDGLVTTHYGRLFADAIEGATLDIIDEAGHMVPYEQPAAAATSIRGFLAGR